MGVVACGDSRRGGVTVSNPLVALEEGDAAVIIRRDVPEPVSYQGTNFLELDFRDGEAKETDFYTEAAFVRPPPGGGSGGGRGFPSTPIDVTKASEVALALRLGSVNNFIAADAVRPAIATTSVSGTVSTGEAAQTEAVDPVAQTIKPGQRAYLFKLVDGSVGARVAASLQRDPEPRLYLVETYRLSTNLGDYGAGRVVKTFSLLPGERTKISLRTFRRSEALRKESSSILDSVTSESAREFQNSVESEQSDKETYEKSFEYHAEAEATASWGWGSAKVSGGVKGSTNAAREEFSKNVTRATEQHAAKASAKREVEVNTSTETTESLEEEQSIEREIRNINVGSALNFVFRQMNQEFFTLLHLIDVRVAFFNGYSLSRMEVPLYDIDSLLGRFVQIQHHATVRGAIRDSLQTILNHKGDTMEDFVLERALPDSDPFLRVNTDKISTYTDPIGGAEFRVQGVITGVTRNVLRTEGVMVEAFLGQASALDGYATRLQELEVERRKAEARLADAEAARCELGNTLASSGDEAKAAILVELERSAAHADDEPDDDT
jgi:hypothetical protein